jgi:polar amino acid transport system permease protein
LSITEERREADAPLTAIPVRHYWRWVFAILIAAASISFLYSLVTNPNLDIGTIREYMFKPFVLRGVGVTIMLTIVAMVIGTLLAVLLAVMRLSDNPVLSTVAWVFVWFFRGTPLLVQIIFWGFLGALYESITIGIPFTDVVFFEAATSDLIGPTMAAVLALSLNEAAYAAEIVRAGILAVDKGQEEAAMALGFTSSQSLRKIVLPQAMRVIVPPMGNETITMLKSTSLVAVIGGKDLLTAVQSVYAQNYKVIPLLVVAALWYLILVSIMTVGQHFIEKRFGRGFGPIEDTSEGFLSRWFGARELKR